MKTHYILNKNATLTPNSCDFYDFAILSQSFVAKFCRRDLRNFSAEFWGRTPQTESLLECMGQLMQKIIVNLRKTASGVRSW